MINFTALALTVAIWALVVFIDVRFHSTIAAWLKPGNRFSAAVTVAAIAFFAFWGAFMWVDWNTAITAFIAVVALELVLLVTASVLQDSEQEEYKAIFKME